MDEPNETLIRTAKLVLHFIYDVSPVSTDEVTREKMLEIFTQCILQDGDLPTREEILPHTRILTPQERKDTLLKIIK